MYSIDMSMFHNSENLTIDFSGFSLQGICDESWGIDNLTISIITENNCCEYPALTFLDCDENCINDTDEDRDANEEEEE